MVFAPIAIFAYGKPAHILKTLEALSNCENADKSKLYIYSDAPRSSASAAEIQKVEEVRKVIRYKKWCGEVEIIEQKENQGLSLSIVKGANEILDKHGRIIILEDDIVVSKGFLNYMNDALTMYENEERVYHITGYLLPFFRNPFKECFFDFNPSVWGWGTWSRAWKKMNPDSIDLIRQLEEKNLWNEFTLNENIPAAHILKENARIQRECNNDMEKMWKKGACWDACWDASVFLNNGLVLHPPVSMTKNIGFDGAGSHSFTGWRAKLYQNQKTIDSVVVKKVKTEIHPQAISTQIAYFQRLNNPPIWAKVKEKLVLVFNNLFKANV